jgi:hypothetical protein
MKPCVFEAATILEADCERIFAFHENPNNIQKIAPPSLRLHRVDCQKSAVPNELFRIEATQFGLPIRWLGRWEKVERPVLLVDSGVESPFKIWRHSHIFEEHPNGCLMTDRVEFLLKGGWPGWLISTFVMPYIFGAMFRARHEATRRWFANQ